MSDGDGQTMRRYVGLQARHRGLLRTTRALVNLTLAVVPVRRIEHGGQLRLGPGAA